MVERVACMRGAAVGWGLFCLFAVTGCGVQVELTSSPDHVTQGEPVNFTIKVTNPSKCPVGDVNAVLIPFFPLPEISLSGDPTIDDAIHQAFQALCTDQPFQLPGLTCQFVNGQLVCQNTGPDTNAPVNGEVPLTSPAADFLSCQREGSRLTCKIRSISSALGTNAAGSPITLPSCVTLNNQMGEINEITECTIGDMAPGASFTTQVTLSALRHGHILDNLLIADAGQQRVCKDGSRQGQPCDVDMDCTGGSMGSCATGICIDNNTQATGAGCNTTPDCGATESCVQCQPNQPGISNVGLDCTQTEVFASAGAPVMSRWGLAAAVVALLAVASIGLRLRPRFR
jgi:hypothetical protein